MCALSETKIVGKGEDMFGEGLRLSGTESKTSNRLALLLTKAGDTLCLRLNISQRTLSKIRSDKLFNHIISANCYIRE